MNNGIRRLQIATAQQYPESSRHIPPLADTKNPISLSTCLTSGYVLSCITFRRCMDYFFALSAFSGCSFYRILLLEPLITCLLILDILRLLKLNSTFFNPRANRQDIGRLYYHALTRSKVLSFTFFYLAEALFFCLVKALLSVLLKSISTYRVFSDPWSAVNVTLAMCHLSIYYA